MAGRPTKYDPVYCEQVEKFCKLGATDVEIADFFNIDEATLYRWKNEHQEFCEAIKRGKLLADANVADALFKRATGYKHPDVDIKMYEGEIITTPLTKYYPPDTAAINIWLKNRRGKVDKDAQRWADKVENEVSLPQGIHVTYVQQAGNEPLNDAD